MVSVAIADLPQIITSKMIKNTKDSYFDPNNEVIVSIAVATLSIHG